MVHIANEFTTQSFSFIFVVKRYVFERNSPLCTSPRPLKLFGEHRGLQWPTNGEVNVFLLSDVWYQFTNLWALMDYLAYKRAPTYERFSSVRTGWKSSPAHFELLLDARHRPTIWQQSEYVRNLTKTDNTKQLLGYDDVAFLFRFLSNKYGNWTNE